MIQIKQALCDGCGTCVSICPHDALLIAHTLELNRSLCTECGACIRVCPFAALVLESV
ncbi:MAG: 4Fe-4S binding protein [Chitinivibrionales bacterium]|nr:4Fe-4S binding protein [Chitinivibrionales bacterium]